MRNRLESAQEEDSASKKLTPEEEEAALNKHDKEEADRWSDVQPSRIGRRLDPTTIEIRKICRVEIQTKWSEEERKKRESYQPKNKHSIQFVSLNDIEIIDDEDPVG